MREYTKPFLRLLASALLFAAPTLLQARQQPGQDQGSQQQNASYNNQGARIAPGQNANIEGVILRRDGNSLMVRDNHVGD